MYDIYYLSHAGVKGMKWGVRKKKPVLADLRGRFRRKTNPSRSQDLSPEEAAARKQKAKKAVKTGAGVAAAGLAVYGAYKVATIVKLKNRTNTMLADIMQNLGETDW